MQKRSNLVTQFSSFLCLKEESSSVITYWEKTPELEQNIQLLLKQQIISSKEDIVAQEFLRWLRKNQDQLKHKHLIAYLQESCFFATQKVYQRLRNYWDLFTWQDYFQWANLLVSSPVKLLTQYDSNLKFKLNTYAKNKIEYQLIDQAYQYMGWERASDWGLLKQLKVGNRRKCLQQIGGLKDINLEKYLLIWECFNLIYKPPLAGRNKKLLPPSISHFIQVGNEYNFLITKKYQNLSSINSEECENILLTCIKFARQYCNPSTITTNEDLDYLTNDKTLNCNNQEENYQDKYDLVNQVLAEAFAKLISPQKILLQLWKGVKLTQTEIAEIMSVNYPNFVTQQFHVAREISLVRTILLDSLIKKILLDEKVKLTQGKIKELKSPLDHWLQEYCQKLLWEKISLIYQSLPSEEKDKLKEYLINKDWTFNDEIEGDFCQKIALTFQKNLQSEFNLVFPESQHIKISFLHLVEEWINDSVYSLINNN
ncbi:MAG: sigma-70 family RNA polymerase sigma factor [Geminocystis sp. GBBB08]|nr:sigma-70 family RNA polymerase sigma factor [Geminocystis sp. GBBB08]